MEKNQQKDQELCEVKAKILEAKNYNDVLKMEEERVKSQLSLLK